MFKSKRIMILFSVLSVITVLCGFLVGSSISVTAASPPQPQHVIYDLYATDGVWIMADGTPLYSYGFVGGKQGSPITPLNYDGTPLGSFTVPEPLPGTTLGTVEAELAGHAQFPAPLITAKVGDVIEIRLKNLGTTNLAVANAPSSFNLGLTDQNGDPLTVDAPNDPHSIHLHALDVNVANDGVPETSLAAIPANGGDPGAGNVVVYMFSAKSEGTFFYHCHQEADIHVDMGMYGFLIIYSPDDAGATQGPNQKGDLFGFKYDKDYIMLLSDTDVRQHLSEAVGNYAVPPTSVTIQTGGGPITANLPYNPVDYKPQYWFVNGLSFPQTIHGFAATDWTNWLNAHPGYDPFIIGSSSAKSFAGTQGQKLLVRVVNMGFETQPMHVHGFHPKVIAKDQRPWTWSSNPVTGMGLEINTLTIGSGETYDLLFDMSAQTGGSATYAGANSNYNPTSPYTPGPGTESRMDLANDNRPVSNLATPTSSFPAIPGVSAGITQVNGTPIAVISDTYVGGPAVPQLFVFHNHDDYKATNNGVYPGGQFTSILVTP